MPYETIELELDDGVAEVTLNRPERLNAWNQQFGEELRSGDPRGRCRPVGARGADHRRRARVLLGRRPQGHARAGRRRRAGPGRRQLLRERYHPIITGIRELPKPVVAAVNGPAVGIGCSLALACDLIWAAESAIFGLAFVNIGLVPDGGSTFLVPAAVGKARALEMALLGEPVPAEQALDWGLINRVVPDGKLMDEARSLARTPGRRPDALVRELEARAQQQRPQDHGRAARPGGRDPGRDGPDQGLPRGRAGLRREARPGLQRGVAGPAELPDFRA